MKLISQTVVHLRRPDEPKLGAYRSATFYEGSGNIPQQLQNLKKSLDDGFIIDSVEVVQNSIPGDYLDPTSESDALSVPPTAIPKPTAR